ncbi:unnamed protein product [Effrenium voratum]|uniref:NOL1/NOP2/Sun domain family member 4 n=1 Tax=Effrenium voratum TaxID=2562239 RepID=A0AA36MXZ0_9DINO|nr:unnamed protein product [Effrenium voratum]
MGACVVAGPTASGQRLQQFVARSFREQLGRQEDALHVNVRQAAALACQKGQVLVDGLPAPGRRVLQEGEVVTLRANRCLELPQRGTKRGGPRMLLCEDDKEVRPAGEGLLRFREYYRNQFLLAPGEWEECERLFLTPVHLSLRLSRANTLTLASLTEAFGERLRFLPWDPLALHLAPGSSSETTEGLQLINVLASNGEIVVQDALSMLPAAALNVQPGDAVLDLCSAPGSKTCQLLDALTCHMDCSAGLLVANDLLLERSERVWARAKCHECSPLIVTTADGSAFPRLLPGGFDRILVDVPCSSDGTLRKEPKRLQRWNVTSGLNHHCLQLSLLRRAVELLKVKGRLVYSTCSLNPIECEAVVQAALAQFPSLRLLPAEEVLPKGCPRGQPGLDTWLVPEGEVATMRPLQRFALHRCARFLPIHGPNFGGFFLAALELADDAGALPCDQDGFAGSEAEPAPLLATVDASFKELVECFGLSSLEDLAALPNGTIAHVTSRMRMCRSVGIEFQHAGMPLLHRSRGRWKVCPEGAKRLAEMAAKCKAYPEGEALQQLLESRRWSCGLDDGPLLVAVPLEHGHGQERWLSGDVVDGQLTLDTPSDERSPSRVPAEMALYPLSCGTQMRVLLKWTPAALGFVAYQLINHQVSMYCSLSERTVFLNLCPLFALFIEPLVLPSRVENVLNQTFASKMALVTMAFGAVLFSLQYRDFTANGLRSAGILVALMLPYRLLQRMLLADCQQVPASLLCAFDGLLLTIPAGTLTIVNERFFIEAYTVLLYNPSIMLMFGLSIFAFIGNHLAVLYLLKATSATSTMVFGNLSNFVVVFEGIVFFSDPVFQAPLVMTGIALSLLGGIWYAIDQTPSEEKGLGNRSPLTVRQGCVVLVGKC